MYRYLFLSYLLILLFSFIRGRDFKWIGAMMGLGLFALVALRASSVGPDTEAYLDLFLYEIAKDNRTYEAGFLLWNRFWRTVGIGGRLYLVVCAIVSIGLFLVYLWRKSPHKILSMSLFLFCFGWTFYLTGIRQVMAMGLFAMGTLLISDVFEIQSLREVRKAFNWKTYLGLFFLFSSPMMHNTAFFALAVLILVFLIRLNRGSYLILLPFTFFVAVFGIFGSADQVVDVAFEMIEDQVSTANRYAGYVSADDAFSTGVSLYLMIKNLLPINLIAIIGLAINRNRKFTMDEHLFFWMIILSNLFYTFSYMFRMRMFLYPMACIALPTLFMPAFQSRRLTGVRFFLALFIVIQAYITYSNLMVMPDFRYAFFFSLP